MKGNHPGIQAGVNRLKQIMVMPKKIPHTQMRNAWNAAPCPENLIEAKEKKRKRERERERERE